MENKFKKIREISKGNFKVAINSILDYIHGNEPVAKEFVYLEKFCIKHGIVGGAFDVILDRNAQKSKKQFAKQIILNVLCWFFAIRLIADLIIFMKVDNKNLINYYGYFGNAFGKDKVSISILSSVLMGMFCSFQTWCKLSFLINK